jgi:hypothetical protein
MILTKAVQNEAVLSNVGTVNSFTIKATAKSFRILSDGLYANKIKAIIRELSCNAYDSHVAVGNLNTPFDVHLPNQLEPWFSVRDYGVGMTPDEVANVFTTFFESTKTGSNDFVGALGLGSKSPFSYTDNFTVTAVKHGVKNVYTAFINDQGVPSIALMGTDENTTDPAGVEIKFAVENYRDFGRFADEARAVFIYFKMRPVVSGYDNFTVFEPEYLERDIVPGVHQIKGGLYRPESVAVMGNIAYPIDIPNGAEVLGDLNNLLKCNLVMEFDIGELDFQASREGLSYIPQTVEAIKAKLEALNAQLAVHVATRASEHKNAWQRAAYLVNLSTQPMWHAAVIKYLADTKFSLVVPGGWYTNLKKFKFTPEVLAQKFNIVLKSFTHSAGEATCKMQVERDYLVGEWQEVWQIKPDPHCVEFVVNDTNRGATERAKHHYRMTHTRGPYKTVYVLESANPAKPMKTANFFKAIATPPPENIRLASTLEQKDRVKGMAANVSIMRLERRGGRNRNSDDRVWRAAATLDKFDDTKTFYYLPVKGFESQGVFKDVKEFYDLISHTGIFRDTVYGVRATDLAQVQQKSNWINLDDHVRTELNKLDDTMIQGLVKAAIDWERFYCYSVFSSVNTNSPYLKLYTEFKMIAAVSSSTVSKSQRLCERYGVKNSQNIDVDKLVESKKQEMKELNQRYPLLKEISRYTDSALVADYINLIDNSKGI